MKALRAPSRVLLAIAAMIVASGCAPETSEEVPTDIADGELSETSRMLSEADQRELSAAGFTADEIKAVAESVSISKLLGVQSFVAEANAGTASADASIRRESHGKGQGCLRAKVDVTTTTGAGVFKSGASYPAWIRLSNGGQFQKDDKSQHISRGWAIKLLDVAETTTRTHDFLFITSPRFFINDITHYPGFLRSSGNGRFSFLLNLGFNMSLEEKQVIFHRLGLKVSNLLESPEYSAVPYSYGKETVKYAVAPCGSTPPSTPESKPPPDSASEDYLEEAMNATLARSKAGVCYSMFVQKPRSNGKDSIQNPTHAWEGAFEQVAKITIPFGQQQGGPADYRENDAECERMAFDPFNTTAAGRPVGKTNLTRKFVYAALSEFRRVEMPQIYARWQKNHNDASIPVEYRDALKKLRAPDALAPKLKDTSQPKVDDGFRSLGIVR
jgi:hypothetical protein